jgi:di/tricarboxylate transporter
MMKATSNGTWVTRLIGAAVFLLIGIVLEARVPTNEIAWVSFILLLTIYLFVFEIVDVDVAAVSIMVLIGLLSLVGPYLGLEKPFVPVEHLFDGFASNAVISIIAIMIIGAGLDKTGIMSRVAGVILKYGGTTEKRIVPLISGTVGIISSFMQNVGAAALFLPVVSRISARSGLPMSRLLMPMGFCAILGGTVTMVGSSPLILLNDLIIASNKALPADQQMDTFSLFDVTPVGLALVASGIVYFLLAGRLVLPTTETAGAAGGDTTNFLKQVYGVDYAVKEVEVSSGSPLVGRTIDEVERQFVIRIVGLSSGSDLRLAPGGLARDVKIPPGSTIAIMASVMNLSRFVESNFLRLRPQLKVFSEILSPLKAGIAEIVIPPGSELIGKSARDVWMRKVYGLSTLAIHRGGKTIHKGEGVRDLPFQAGDTLVCYVNWESLVRLESDRNFVIVTSEYPREETRPHKVRFALFFFLVALFLVLFTDLRLSVSLLTGALGMVLSGVLSMEEAYKAVSWKTVFLLASLIPLGVAVESTGTAAWIAAATLEMLGDVPGWVIQAALAVLATFFTLVMSNVGATVLLVPLAVNLAVATGADPALYALTVAIATSDSFLIPTHQVNALLMGPGGYRVPDFMRAGGIMTVLFLVVMLAMMNFVF